MNLDEFRALIPESAKDIKLNLSSVLMQAELTPLQTWGTAVSCALNTNNKALIEAINQQANLNISEQEFSAAQTAGYLMAMNNVYYRFTHLVNDPEFATLPAKLRMNGLRSHGVSQVDFELWCLAVSALNGCGMCVESHWKQLQEHKVGREVITAVVRIGAVIKASSLV